MRAAMITAVLCIALISGANADAAFSQNQLTTSALVENQQRALFTSSDGSSPFLLPVNSGLPSSNIVDNAAIRQLVADKSGFPFLATLPRVGVSGFITVLKPCASILPHVHPRGNEQYIIISGTMTGGIAQEFGAPQNMTFQIKPGQTMLVPQGLLHYNENNNCEPNIFIQAYDSSDPGTVSIPAGLAGLSAANPTEGKAGNFTTAANPLGPFGLDQSCLQRCNLPSTGAPGNGLSSLSQELQVFLGIASASSSPSASPPVSAGGPISG